MMYFMSKVMEIFSLDASNSALRQRGATLIEYALIIAAIAVVVLFGALAITGDLTSFFSAVGGELTVE